MEGRIKSHIIFKLSVLFVALCGIYQAILNGAPFVFYDSVYYVSSAKGLPLAERPNLYSPLFGLLGLANKIWLWVFFQGIFASLILHVAFRNLIGPGKLLTRLILLSAFMLFSALGFETSYLMADFSTGLCILSTALILAYGSKIYIWEKFWLALLNCLLISFHSSNVLILSLLLIAAIPISCVSLKGEKPNFYSYILISASLLMVYCGLCMINFLNFKTWTFAPKGNLFLFASLYSAGPLKEDIGKFCSANWNLVLNRHECEHIKNLPEDSSFILWDKNSILDAHSLRWKHYNQVAGYLVKTHIFKSPWKYFKNIFKSGARQFWDWGVEYSTIGYEESLKCCKNFIAGTYSSSFWQNLQNSLRFNELYPAQALTKLYKIQYWLGIISIISYLVFGAKKRDGFYNFAFLILIGVVTNALVTGGLSAVHNRYQLRVAWLPFFFAVILILRYSEFRRLAPLSGGN